MTRFRDFNNEVSAAGAEVFELAGAVAGAFGAAEGWGLDLLIKEAEEIQRELINTNPTTISIELTLASRKAFLEVWLIWGNRARLETIAELTVFIRILR